MLRSLWSVFAICAAATAAAAQPASTLPPHAPAVTSQPAEPGAAHVLSRADLETWLDGFMPYALQRGDVAGAVVVVVKDGGVLLQKGYGYADVAARRPVDPETTLFRPGSVSKLITWTAVMQLVEQGRIDLDRDINAYLDFRIPPFDGRLITMRNLMTHTAGFQDSLKNLVTTNPKATPLRDFLTSQIPDRIFPPGEIPAYSNYGATLAGYIVQRLSGEDFDDYVAQHIFAPLDMRHSTFRQPLPAAFKSFLSKGYLLGSGSPEPFEMFGTAPAGGSTVSGADMAKFMIAHLQDGEYDGRRILQPATARLMHDTALTTINPALERMELGFYDENRNGHRIIGHGGDTRVFHSDLALFPDDHVGIFISLNSVGRRGATYAIRSRLLDGFADRYFPGTAQVPHENVPPAMARAHAALLVGQYDGSRREETGFASIINLLSQTDVGVDAQGHIVASAITGLNDQPKVFEEIAPFLWREVGGQDLLAAKVVGGKVAMWSGGGDAPTVVYTPTSAWRDATWLGPLLLLSIVSLLLTAISWPVAALVRRHFGARFPFEGRAAQSYRWVRIAVVADGIVIAVWLAIIGMMWATFYVIWAPYFISSAMIPWILIAHVLAILVFPLAALVSLWNLWVVCTSRAGWRNAFAWLGNAIIAASCLTVLWTAIVFHLIGLGTDF